MGAFITLSAGVLALAITVLVYFRRPPPGVWPSLFFFALSVTLWAIGEFFTSYATEQEHWYWMWLAVEYTGILGLPPAWWVVTLRFAKLCGHRVRWATWPIRYGPAAFAAVFWSIMVTNPIHESFMIANVDAPNVRYPLWYVSAAGCYVVILASIAVLLWLSRKPLKRDYVAQVRMMLAGATLPLLLNFIYNTRVLDLGFDFTVAAFSVLALVFSFGIYRHRLFALSPVSLNHVIYNEPNALIITDREGRVCFANASAESLFWSSAELVDSPIFPIMDAVFEGADRPGMPPGFKALCNSSRTEQTLNSGDLLRLRGTGRYFVFVGTTIPGWRKGASGFGIRLIDVTDAENVKAQLAEQGGAMAAILDTVREGILVVDANGKMLFFNDIFQTMWNLPEHIVEARRDEDAINHVLNQMTDPDAFVARIQELYASPQESSDRDEIHLKDGRIFERSSRPLYNDEQTIGRVWTFQDVTDARKQDEERQALELKVLEAQKLDSLGMLAGGIAHDFNNILVGVLGNAEFAMESAEEGSELRDGLGDIVQAAQRAGDLCRQLLAYSGRGQVVVSPTNLSELVEDTSSLISVSVPKHCSLRMELADSLPAVEADVTQLRQIVMNLATNAAEAIGGESGEIVIRTGAVKCTQSDLNNLIADEDVTPGDYVYIEVEDTGSGIDEATLQRMFDPFFSTKFAGRGFGLAAVRGIARSHRAALGVTTELGKGTRIRVLFPASSAAARPLHEDAPDESANPCTGTVLVVDDEPHVLEVMQRTLDRSGYTVLTASNGADALNVFKERHRELQAVVLDMTMPGLNGSTTYDQMREIAAVPIVLASGYSEGEVVERFGDGEAPLFLQKPFRTRDLLRAVNTAIRGAV